MTPYVPQAFRQTQPGIYERAVATPSTAPDILQSYATRAEDILLADRAHYTRLMPQLSGVLSSLPLCAEIMAWGGGHPKIEANILSINPQAFEIPMVHVIDAAANSYATTHELFEKHYGVLDVNYIPIARIDPLLVAESQAPESATPALNTFVHFLEHASTWEQVCSYIFAVQPAPILIYGPNIAVATGPEWFHFKPKDHNVFWLPEVMDHLLRTYYPHVHTQTFSDDLFHLAW